MAPQSPVGSTADRARRGRARRSAEYRAEAARVAPYEEVARMIIRLRMDHSLTQEGLAGRIGTSKSAISRLESGQHAPSAETLRKIARAFDMTLVIGMEESSSLGPETLARVG